MDSSERHVLTVTSPRLHLRPLAESDRAEFIHGHESSREHLAPWTPVLAPGTTLSAYFDQELQRCSVADANGSGCRRVAQLTPDACRELGIDPTRRPIAAYVSLNNIVRGSFQCCDMGWRVMAEFTGRGFGTEAVSAVLDLAFAPQPLGLGLHRVQANIIPRNERSLRLAAKVGFRLEGLALQMLHIAGIWEDHLMHAKLAGEHRVRYLLD